MEKSFIAISDFCSNSLIIINDFNFVPGCQDVVIFAVILMASREIRDSGDS